MSTFVYRRDRKIRDPESQKGLVSRKISEGEIVAMINEYQSNTKVKCNIAGCGTPHNKGWTAQLESGGLALIGHICQKRVISEDDYKVLHREWAVDIKRQRLHALIGREDFDPAALAKIITAAWLPSADLLRKAKKALMDMGNASGEISEAISRKDGSLTITRMVADTVRIQAEMERRSDDDDRPPPKYKLEMSDQIHRIVGGSFLVASLPIKDMLLDARHMLNVAAEIIESDDPDDADLEAAINDCREARRKLDLVRRTFDDYSAFRKCENLAGIATWIKTKYGVQTSSPADGQLLVQTSKRSELPLTIELPATEGWSKSDLNAIRG